MDSTVDAMASALDALIDAATAAIREHSGASKAAALEDVMRCMNAFHESCNHAQGLVQAAAQGLGHTPNAAGDTMIDVLGRAVEDAAAAVQGEEKDCKAQEK